MIYCINCGTRNEADAAFCLSCGQTLYRQSTGSPPKSAPNWDRQRLFVVIFTVSALAILLVVGLLVVLKPSGESKIKQNASNESSTLIPKITDKAVLTIIGTDRRGTSVVQGSGFIVTSDGLAISNYHVLNGVSLAAAECCGGRDFEIRSVNGSDRDKDLILFQLYDSGSTSKPHDLPHVVLGSSHDVAVGERVIVIGSPQGLENTMSDGILSAIREFEATRLLQITAPISPGSSGGPVFNSNGQVVGIASFQFAKGQNLNFAIAAEYVQPLLDQHLNVTLAQFESFDKRPHRELSSPTASKSPGVPERESGNVASSLTGQFAGVVHNLNANVSAEFGILVNDTDGTVWGCMGVKQPLFGSGPFSGVIDGSKVSFVVKSAIGEITFDGQLSGNELNGTYTVAHQNAPSEQGTFTLRKIKSAGLRSSFDTSNCPTDAEMNQ